MHVPKGWDTYLEILARVQRATLGAADGILRSWAMGTPSGIFLLSRPFVSYHKLDFLKSILPCDKGGCYWRNTIPKALLGAWK